jgi:hypothetical protein
VAGPRPRTNGPRRATEPPPAPWRWRLGPQHGTLAAASVSAAAGQDPFEADVETAGVSTGQAATCRVRFSRARRRTAPSCSQSSAASRPSRSNFATKGQLGSILVEGASSASSALPSIRCKRWRASRRTAGENQASGGRARSAASSRRASSSTSGWPNTISPTRFRISEAVRGTRSVSIGLICTSTRSRALHRFTSGSSGGLLAKPPSQYASPSISTA